MYRKVEQWGTRRCIAGCNRALQNAAEHGGAKRGDAQPYDSSLRCGVLCGAAQRSEIQRRCVLRDNERRRGAGRRLYKCSLRCRAVRNAEVRSAA